MKLQPDRSDAPTILGYGPNWIGVGHQGVAEKIEHSLVLDSRGRKMDWQCSRFEALQEAHFDQLAGLQPELVVFGSGARLRFPPPVLLHRLMAQRIGLETMDTVAACRTYNILAGEGRHVVAALLIEREP
ncbi:MAG: Mth938-like domain-containing protein [Comamonadaceae bacterium]|nr:Mth938-like domain-containing protein [Comamonadaceae bacterium]